MTYTQEQLEGMSDGELNDIVSLYGGYKKIPLYSTGTCNPAVNVQKGWVSKDYCNNPSDMWPLIVEVGIGIEPTPGVISKKLWNASKSGVVCMSKNPLRAAAIVYILVKQGESDAQVQSK